MSQNSLRFCIPNINVYQCLSPRACHLTSSNNISIFRVQSHGNNIFFMLVEECLSLLLCVHYYSQSSCSEADFSSSLQKFTHISTLILNIVRSKSKSIIKLQVSFWVNVQFANFLLSLKLWRNRLLNGSHILFYSLLIFIFILIFIPSKHFSI